MSDRDGYIQMVSGYEISLHHTGGIRTWMHPNRETQLARLTSVLTTVSDAIVVHDKEVKRNVGRSSQLVRQIKLEAPHDLRTGGAGGVGITEQIRDAGDLIRRGAGELEAIAWDADARLRVAVPKATGSTHRLSRQCTHCGHEHLFDGEHDDAPRCPNCNAEANPIARRLT